MRELRDIKTPMLFRKKETTKQKGEKSEKNPIRNSEGNHPTSIPYKTPGVKEESITLV